MSSSAGLSATLCSCVTVAAIVVTAGRSISWARPPAQDSGQEVYQQYCAGCHDHPGPRTPPRSALEKLSVARILHTLDFGVMMSIAYPLERSQREAVAKFLGTPGGDSGPSPAAFCSSRDFAWTHDPSASWPGVEPLGSEHTISTR